MHRGEAAGGGDGVRVVALSNASYSVVHARVGGNRERGDRAQTQNGERTMI